jgi:hypothetical protein
MSTEPGINSEVETRAFKERVRFNVKNTLPKGPRFRLYRIKGKIIYVSFYTNFLSLSGDGRTDPAQNQNCREQKARRDGFR